LSPRMRTPHSVMPFFSHLPLTSTPSAPFLVIPKLVNPLYSSVNSFISTFGVFFNSLILFPPCLKSHFFSLSPPNFPSPFYCPAGISILCNAFFSPSSVSSLYFFFAISVHSSQPFSFQFHFTRSVLSLTSGVFLPRPLSLLPRRRVFFFPSAAVPFSFFPSLSSELCSAIESCPLFPPLLCLL